jgi:hypothetical protein
MNDIVKPVTPDGMVGWDEFNQLWAWKMEGANRVGTIIADVREKTCAVCRRGWDLTGESLLDQFYWRSRAEWAHETCYIRYLALEEFDFWVNALVGARFMFGSGDGRGPSLESLPNGYHSASKWFAGQPWYRARLLKRGPDDSRPPLGRTLRLGARKRVYHLQIEAGEAPYDAALAEKIFAPEDVTKSINPEGMYIHAWGQAKAKEYLGHFAEILHIEKK